MALPNAGDTAQKQLLAEQAYQNALRQYSYQEAGINTERSNLTNIQGATSQADALRLQGTLGNYAADRQAAGLGLQADLAGIGAERGGITARVGAAQKRLGILGQEIGEFRKGEGRDAQGEIDPNAPLGRAMMEFQRQGADIGQEREASAGRGFSSTGGLAGQRQQLLTYLAQGERAESKSDFNRQLLGYEGQKVGLEGDVAGGQADLAGLGAREQSARLRNQASLLGIGAAENAARLSSQASGVEDRARYQAGLASLSHDADQFPILRDEALQDRNYAYDSAEREAIAQAIAEDNFVTEPDYNNDWQSDYDSLVNQRPGTYSI